MSSGAITSSLCMTASVYASHGEDELTRVCSLYELPSTQGAPIWQGLEMSAAHPNRVGLKILSSEHGILRSFSKAFSRLFGMRFKLHKKDVVGARIKAIDVSEFTITIYEPLVVLIIDGGGSYSKAAVEVILPKDPDTEEPLDTEPPDPKHPQIIERHIHGQRLLYIHEGFLNLKLPQFFATFIFMFEVCRA